MAHFQVNSSKLSGDIRIPSSKSHTLRAILFGSLGKGKTIIHHPLISADGVSMIEACRLLGAMIDRYEHHLEISGINGKVEHAEDVIHAGNSGLVLRMIAAVAALASRPIVITGDYSIRHQRPVLSLIDGLQQLGVSAISTKGDGFAPLIINGPLHAGKAVIHGEDSQPVSSLLIASIFAPGPVELTVINPGEKPWVALTLEWFKRLGVDCQYRDYSSYRMPGKSGYDGFEYTVPGDWSSAAFPLAAALVTGSEITLHNVDVHDCQGDKAVLDVFKLMGASIDIDASKRMVHVAKGAKLVGVEVDINHFVDAITILAAVACYAEGETRLYNASVAKQKECNRIHCIANELAKMGADMTEHDDGLTIRGSRLKGAKVFSHHDHRMAMSLAVAGMGASGITHIDEVGCVAKTFPTFAHDFKLLGAQLEVRG